MGLAFALISPGSLAAEEGDPPVEVTVKAVPITRAALHEMITAYGRIESAPAQADQPGGLVRLSPASSGIVTRVACQVGHPVRQGDVLVQLENQPLDVAVQSARQNLAKQQELLPVGGASGKDVREAEQALAAVLAQQSLLQIKAPINGLVTLVDVQRGESVDTSQILIEIINPHQVVAQVAVPAAELTTLAVGQSATITMSGRAATVPATVRYVSPQIDPATGTGLVRLSLPTDSGLRSGEFITARINVDDNAEGLVVPISSVYTDADGVSTISLVKQGKSARQTVQLGVREHNLITIAGDGLVAGQLVVTVGSYALPDDTLVLIDTAPTP